jgi:hypothetical protein
MHEIRGILGFRQDQTLTGHPGGFWGNSPKAIEKSHLCGGQVRSQNERDPKALPPLVVGTQRPRIKFAAVVVTGGVPTICRKDIAVDKLRRRLTRLKRNAASGTENRRNVPGSGVVKTALPNA